MRLGDYPEKISLELLIGTGGTLSLKNPSNYSFMIGRHQELFLAGADEVRIGNYLYHKVKLSRGECVSGVPVIRVVYEREESGEDSG